MKLTKGFSGLVIVCLLLSLAVTVGAAPSGNDVPTASTVVNSGGVAGADRPLGGGGGGGGGKPDLTLSSDDIDFEPSAPTTDDAITIRATIHNTGQASADSVLVQFSADDALIGVQTIASIGGRSTAIASFGWGQQAAGTYTVTVRVDPGNTIPERKENNNEASKDVTVTEPGAPPPPTADYELSIEIDYMAGHYPTQAVLDYIEGYYMGNNPTGDLIEVTFHADIYDEGGKLITDDPISELVPLDESVSDADFWAIEAAYNDGADNAGGNPNSGKYYSKEKWVLYGTNVEAYPDVVGYCYIVVRGFIQQDCVAGNYIFVADEAADSWASGEEGVAAYGAEAVVLMHEMGHSIGIGEFLLNTEIYDSDWGSVMSYLSVDNARLYDRWYYSAQYWATRNMQYYKAG